VNPGSCIPGPMTVLDYLVLLVVAASVVSGVTKGIIRGIVSVVFAAAGLVLAAHSYSIAAGLMQMFAAEWLANLLGFLMIFVLVVAGGSLLAWRLRRVLKRARLGWLDHASGAAFGLLRGWLICSGVYLALTAFPLRPVAVEQATLAPALIEGTRVIALLTSPELRERFLDGYEKVRELWDQKR
jgi:membrane protein required for colicin V production